MIIYTDVISDIDMTQEEILKEFSSINYGTGWQSDWNGDEVGFDDVDVVGYYRSQNGYFFVDMSSFKEPIPLHYFDDSMEEDVERVGEEYCVTVAIQI